MEGGVSKKNIAHEIGGVQNDTLRFGLDGVKGDILNVHPVQSAYESVKLSDTEMKRLITAKTYGTALPLKMDLDRQILSRFQRPPGLLQSCMLGYEALTGSLDEYNVEDFHIQNDPREPTYRPSDMHHGMEVRLGLSKGPVYPTCI